MSSYFGLFDAKKRASDKDLLTCTVSLLWFVQVFLNQTLFIDTFFLLHDCDEPCKGGTGLETISGNVFKNWIGENCRIDKDDCRPGLKVNKSQKHFFL